MTTLEKASTAADPPSFQLRCGQENDFSRISTSSSPHRNEESALRTTNVSTTLSRDGWHFGEIP
jgi:hypothetical protein